MTRKSKIGGGGWQGSMALSGRAISVLTGINGLGNKLSDLIGPPFPMSYSGRHFLRDLVICLLIHGCGCSSYYE